MKVEMIASSEQIETIILTLTDRVRELELENTCLKHRLERQEEYWKTQEEYWKTKEQGNDEI